MAKWFGKIGYEITEEVEPGIHEPTIVERQYYGDLVNNPRWKRQNSSEVNDSITLSNSISVLSDPFIDKNCANIAYVEVNGTKWKVSDIEIAFPRLNLTIGGVYNG